MNFNLLIVKVILLILIAMNEVLIAQTHTVTIRLNHSTGQDAYIADNYLNIPWPNHPDLVSTSWTNGLNPASARCPFQFYLNSIPNHSNIIDARLSLYANPDPINYNHAGENESYIRRIVSQWNANSVTWETHPDFTYHNQVFLSRSISPMQDYLNINVTNLIRDMINNPASGYGFLLMLRFEYPYASMNFASSDCIDSSKRPLLQITYSPVGINPVSNEIPSQYKIYQNYPNPFNPVTNIKFDIPRKSYTKIDIFDMLGKNVETLVNETIDAGSYNLDWNGENFSSGEYFYRIVTDDFVETKRMTLLK